MVDAGSLFRAGARRVARTPPRGFSVRCTTCYAIPARNSNLVRRGGFEPPASCFGGRRSYSTELPPHAGAVRGIRTLDLPLRRRTLFSTELPPHSHLFPGASRAYTPINEAGPEFVSPPAPLSLLEGRRLRIKVLLKTHAGVRNQQSLALQLRLISCVFEHPVHSLGFP